MDSENKMPIRLPCRFGCEADEDVDGELGPSIRRSKAWSQGLGSIESTETPVLRARAPPIAWTQQRSLPPLVSHVRSNQGFAMVHDLHPGGAGELRQRRLAGVELRQASGVLADASELLLIRAVRAHGHRTVECPVDGLADPPGGVGHEPRPVLRIEPGRCVDHPGIAFVDQVGEREPEVLVLLRDHHDVTQVTGYQRFGPQAPAHPQQGGGRPGAARRWRGRGGTLLAKGWSKWEGGTAGRRARWD